MGSLPINTLVRSVAVDTVTPERVYAAGPAGLFRSDDAGKKWTPAGEELPTEPLAITLNPAEPQTVFVLLADNSVWRSTDGATTWQPAE
jgi:photosystem II stability/assembly factor-like uncharacterized protein